MYNKIIIVIPAHKKDASNSWMKDNIDKEGGENTFIAGLSYNGQTPATHYWCAGILDNKNTDLIKQNFDVVYYDKTPMEVLAIEGLSIITN